MTYKLQKTIIAIFGADNIRRAHRHAGSIRFSLTMLVKTICDDEIRESFEQNLGTRLISHHQKISKRSIQRKRLVFLNLKFKKKH
ncbi:MAG: hypothetical protein ACHQNT_02465 [Bacteroidia bacterium]